MPRNQSPSDRVPTGSDEPTFRGAGSLEVDLPGGGKLTLLTPDEVVMWNEARDRYIKDYRINKQNDLILLGSLLSQVLVMYRAQRELSDPKTAATAQAMISNCADDIRKAEKALGIDKATREKGGQHTVSEYVIRLKRAAYEKGVHLSKRLKAYEQLVMETQWRIRLYRNGDTEDKQYHRIATPEQIIDWLEKELAKLEDADKKWAREKGSVFVGKL